MPTANPSTATAGTVNMHLLELFVAVADHGSFAGAARTLGISPSLAVRKIAALERSLGVRLFQRTTRSVKLAEAGQVALQWARRTLASYESVADDLASLAARPSGLVRLAVNHYAATTYLPGILERFCLRYPEIRLAITTTDSVVRLIDEGHDLAVHSGRIPDSGVVATRVREFRRVLCAAPAYLARRGAPEVPADLGAHDCLVHATNEPNNWFFRKGRRLTAQPVRPYIEADTHLLLHELACHGLGIARLGYNVVRRDLEDGRLVEVMPDYKSVYSTGELPGIWILYPNRRVLYRTRVLIDFLAAALEDATP
ncbi:MAG: LysR family transcriptional regulator [Burkholderiales bacterium]|nr:LysR family transcriptional regulator [Burkholderiales bacterium]